MTTTDFTTTITVAQSPQEVFDAINNPRGWWSEEIDGPTTKENDIFDYHFEDIHRCQIKIIESVPNKKVVWYVIDNYFKPGIFESEHTGSDDKTEWVDTKIVFEIDAIAGQTELRFTHLGLVPQYECYDACSNGWSHYITQSLHGLITTGNGQPNKTGAPMTETEEKIRETGKA
jgi:uncharacterized protein YndB with AHSA1/START domain